MNRSVIRSAYNKMLERCITSPTGCVEYQGAKSGNGYTSVRIGDVLISGHRLAYQAVKGRIRKGNVIRHTCDNPSCVNPEHLLQGTQFDNVTDAMARGRVRRGQNAPPRQTHQRPSKRNPGPVLHRTDQWTTPR